MYFEDGLVVDAAVLTDNVGVHHLVVDDTEGGGVAAGLVTSLPSESRVGEAVVEARGFVLSLQLIVCVGQAVTVRRQPQTQLVLRDGELHGVLHPGQLQQGLSRRGGGEGLLC